MRIEEYAKRTFQKFHPMTWWLCKGAYACMHIQKRMDYAYVRALKISEICPSNSASSSLIEDKLAIFQNPNLKLPLYSSSSSSKFVNNTLQTSSNPPIFSQSQNLNPQNFSFQIQKPKPPNLIINSIKLEQCRIQ